MWVCVYEDRLMKIMIIILKTIEKPVTQLCSGIQHKNVGR